MEDVTSIGENEQMISLDNLFNETGQLAWKPSQVKDFMVGDFKITGVISNVGSDGLVLSCVDEKNTQYALKLRRESSVGIDNVALRGIWDHSYIRQTPPESIHIPKLIETLNVNDKEITVMELLGPDLFTLQTSLVAFSLKTTLQIAL